MDKLDSLIDESKRTWGGKREGAGRREGSKNKKTLEQDEAIHQFRERVRKNVDKLFNAQISKALGEHMLFVKVTERDSKGKTKRVYYERVEDEETIKEFLDDEDSMNDDEHYYYLTTRPADNKAIDSMMDRAFGRANQSMDLTSGGETINGVIDPAKAAAYAEFLKKQDV